MLTESIFVLIHNSMVIPLVEFWKPGIQGIGVKVLATKIPLQEKIFEFKWVYLVKKVVTLFLRKIIFIPSIRVWELSSALSRNLITYLKGCLTSFDSQRQK